MKLTKLLIPITLGIASISCQAQPTKNPLDYIPSPITKPKEPKNHKEQDYTDIKAILLKEDNFSEEVEIKYKK